MPFNIWCLGCNAHIGKGVRYNAEKKSIGAYHSTKIFSFKMKCHLCSNIIEIQTDPKNSDYVCASGAQKKIEEWESKDSETIELIKEEEKTQLQENPMFKLEYQQKDQNKAEEMAPIIASLQDLQEAKKDDFELSYLARKKFREKKKENQAQLQHAKKLGLSVPLLPNTEEDIISSKQIKFAGNDLETQERKRKLILKSSSIFSNSKDIDKVNPHTDQKIQLLSQKKRRLT